MVQFLVKRFIGLIFVIIGVTFITFILGLNAPGDPIQELLGNHVIHSVYVSLKHSYGLNLPWYHQYWNFLTNLARFNLGLSFQTRNYPVWNILKNGVPVSAELGFFALILQLLIGIPIGILSALKANSWVDTVNMGIMLVLFALPSFVLAIFAQLIIVWLEHRDGRHVAGCRLGHKLALRLERYPVHNRPRPRVRRGRHRPLRPSRPHQYCWKCCARITCAPPAPKGCASASWYTVTPSATP